MYAANVKSRHFQASGRVLDSNLRGQGLSLTIGTALCPSARHFIYCLSTDTLTYFGLNMIKPVLGGLGTTRVQTGLHIDAIVVRLLCPIKACFKRNFTFLASLRGWTGWFETHFVK